MNNVFVVKKDALSVYLLVAVLSAHVLAELVRRFVVQSDSLYLLADVVLIFSALISSQLIGGFRFSSVLALLLGGYIFLGLLSHLPGEHSLLLIPVGLRPLVMGVSAYIVVYSAFCRNYHAPYVFLAVLLMITIMVSIVAALQLFLGADHSINQIAGLERGGRGDAYDQYGIIFRPTSIFMHTGRFGQYAFFLATVFISALICGVKERIVIAGIFISLVGVLLSGQRAAMVFLLVFFGYLIVRFGEVKNFLRLASGALVMLFLLMIFSKNFYSSFIDRMSSGFTGAISRVIEMGKESDVGFERYALLGEGLGFFSFGSRSFGGDVYYSYMRQFGGGGENSWLSMQGEVGTVGALLFLCAMIYMSYISYVRTIRFVSNQYGIWHMASFVLSVSMIFWGLTHNVYYNYLQVVALFSLFGASTGILSVSARQRS